MGRANTSQRRTHCGQGKRRCIQVSDDQEITTRIQVERRESPTDCWDAQESCSKFKRARSSREPCCSNGEVNAGRQQHAERRDGEADVQRQNRPDSGAEIEIPAGRDSDRACRELRITNKLLNKYGYTPDCDGCEFKQARSDSQRQHSTVCRQRIYAAMMQEEAGAAIIEGVKRRLERNNVGESEETQ